MGKCELYIENGMENCVSPINNLILTLELDLHYLNSTYLFFY